MRGAGDTGLQQLMDSPGGLPGKGKVCFGVSDLSSDQCCVLDMLGLEQDSRDKAQGAGERRLPWLLQGFGPCSICQWLMRGLISMEISLYLN